jgi:O-antigen ligase
MYSQEKHPARPSAPLINSSTIVPFLAAVHAIITEPLITFAYAPAHGTLLVQSDLANRIFWPVMAVTSVILAAKNYSRFGRFTVPPHIIWLLAYVTFAGASVLWALKPEISFVRFLREVMIITSIVLPVLLAARTVDLVRALSLCFALAGILHLIFVLSIPFAKTDIGYRGYLQDKNALGQFAAIACLLAIYEAIQPGFRRALGIFGLVVASLLLLLSNSKTSLGLALLSPILALVTLTIAKICRASPAVALLPMVGCYVALSGVLGFNANRLSYAIYGDPTFSGRTVIWYFVNQEIARRPLLGWGYQSFWQVGPDGPSLVDTQGWVRQMPHGHNGYLDTMLEMGYVGFALLVIFIIATLHAMRRVRHPGRAWLMLSIGLLIILDNFLESIWMRGSDSLWLVFVFIATEIGRYWQPLTAQASRSQRSDRFSPLPGTRRPVRI